MVVKELLRSAASLRDDADELVEAIVAEATVDCVYNPLRYAWDVHTAYLRKAGDGGATTLLLGMNPGPHGMGQMGIPFAATSVVRDLLGITDIEVSQPRTPHDRRPINGLSHPKEEVSGTRLWGVLADRYGTATSIFQNVFLVNHCPLMFFSGTRAANITPEKVSGPAVTALLERCDQHLREVVSSLGAETVIGVGKYAEARARNSLVGTNTKVTSCWHPSPASPLANRNGGADWRANILAVLP
jgi:single-strand selective monofunctional uracil DNA glycosylase